MSRRFLITDEREARSAPEAPSRASAMISTLLNTAAGSHRFLAFGDSWAWLGFDQFKAALAPHSINASRHAIPGTPAGYWAWAQPEALVNAVDATNADAVYLSIGGNDFLEGLPAGHHAETLFEEMMASTRLVLTRLFEQRPHVLSPSLPSCTCSQPRSHISPHMHGTRTRRSTCSAASSTRASRASSPATHTITL